MLLRHYLTTAARRGFAWGENDCILFAAGWAQHVCGRDPAQDWRGHYRNEEAANACLQRAGGLEQAIHGALIACGWRRAATAKPGDIVLATLPGHDGKQAAGICVGRNKTALITRKGLVVAPVPVLRAWRHG